MSATAKVFDMDGIQRVAGEETNLALHVDICAQRQAMVYGKLDDLQSEINKRFSRGEKLGAAVITLLGGQIAAKMPGFDAFASNILAKLLGQ